MPVYESLFRKVLFPAYETVVKRRGTASYVAEYERNQWLPAAQLDALRLKKLNALLDHCWQHVPALKLHWERHGTRRRPLSHLDEIVEFPVLTKTDISQNYADMIARPWRGKTLTKTTGGSTGQPFRFEYTMDAYARRTAVMWRGYGWGGAGLGTRTAYLWGTGLRKGGWGGLKDRLYHGAFNRHFIDAFSMTTANIDERIDELVSYRPNAVVGYVTPVVLVARRMLETGRTIKHVRAVLTGAEALHEPDRDAIGRAFGCAVFNTYGSREVMLMAAECPCHEGLHVNADHLLFETLDDGARPVEAGISGNVAVTDFHNFGMPMVRYLNGDRATYAAKSCSCGRTLPLLASIDGRILDMIQTPDGRQVPGEFFVYAMLGWPEVRQWQVIQTAPDRVELRLVLPPGWPAESRSQLLEKVRGVVGHVMTVDIVEVDRIATTASGKRRLTISLTNATMADPGAIGSV